ncbi:hypothetical protein BYT27DRAFT_7223627 [Phlegmacium glaucopus]|nr:hypothetical protein BYT27DRAFT_7223627 [Phlegmacium glaucopus]
MSEKTARVLTQPSNRSKPRDGKEKKVVFKGVLDSPFRVQWPSVPINLQNAVLAYILQILEGVSEYHDNRSALSRKRKRAAKSSCDALAKDKKQKLLEQGSATDDAMSGLVEQSSKRSSDNDDNVDDMAAKSPSILRHIVYGINAVTKRLELQSHSLRRPTTVIPIPSVETQPSRPFKYLFVCRQDVDPSILIDHLPHLVASCNSAQASNHMKLVPLPKGSELVLAQTLGIRRVTVLGIDVDLADDRLHTMLEPVPVLTASWLSNAKLPTLIPTHVKHLRTSAPKDMKAAKEARNREKAEVKKAKK